MNKKNLNDVCVIGAGLSGLVMAAMLTKNNFRVTVFEKMNRVGGRTASSHYKNHILDNGFHIMPFYKKSFVYEALVELGIVNELKLTKVHKIAFFSNKEFYQYPKGLFDLLRLSMVPLKSRLSLIRLILPLAFMSIKKTESLDSISVHTIIKDQNSDARAFFEAICMLAFADVSEHISLGEFARTMIRANPFRGGTSDFAYPQEGGYDKISQILSDFIQRNNNKVELNTPVKQILVKDGCVKGLLLQDGDVIETKCVVVSVPAYEALKFFPSGVFPNGFVKEVNNLNKTTSVVEVHFALSKKLTDLQVIFPVGSYVSKGVFFISNIAPKVSPRNEYLMIAGTPITSSDADDAHKIRSVVDTMKTEMASIFDDFSSSLLWERPMVWRLVESVSKSPGMVWKSKMPHVNPYVKGLFFVGDSTISYGIGTDSAAHSSMLCFPIVHDFLKN